MASETPTPTTFDLGAASALAALSTSSPPASSASNPGSASIIPTSTGSLQPLSKNKNTLSGAAIIGIVTSVCSITLITLAIFLWRRRRRRQNASATPFSVHGPVIPQNENTPYNSEARSSSKVRRSYLQNELRAAQEEIVNIRQLKLEPQAQPNSVLTSHGRVLRVFSSPREANAGRLSSDVVTISQLTARIHDLEAQISQWVLGPESPPGYSDEEALKI